MQIQTRRYFITAVLSTLAGIFTVTGVVSAVAGQFDSLKVGKAGAGGVTYFNGTIINETSTGATPNPLTVGDDLRVDGKIWRGATRGPIDSQELILDDHVRVTGGIGTGSHVNITGGLTTTSHTNIGGDLTVAGNTGMTGFLDMGGDIALSDGSSLNALWTAQIAVNNSRGQDIRRIVDFLSCVGDFAEVTSVLESDDYIFCWNLWIAGYAFPAGSGSGGPDESVRMQDLIGAESSTEFPRR